MKLMNRKDLAKMAADDHRSRYDPSRSTLGKISSDLAKSNAGANVRVGDVACDLTTSLVNDLNEQVKQDPYNGRVYYAMFTEHRQAHMKNVFDRKITTTLYRPWPEDDTQVFKIDPVNERIWFCWCLPHYSSMVAMMKMYKESPDLAVMMYGKESIDDVITWRNYDLHRFGFKKDEMGNWIPNPDFPDKTL